MIDSVVFSPTRSEGLSRLSNFVPKAGQDYAKLRNSDFGRGQHKHVSSLSPYIRHRLISEREVVSASIKTHGFPSCEKFVQEVFWRSYFKGWLEHNPHIWSRYKTALNHSLVTLGADSDLNERYNQALAGQTNIACFDYWVMELVETGYLHNHARMWFASIWIFTLKLPWELGADFFMRNLIDGDPASNTLSWRWVAGLHTKGKTYLARPDNIARFTNGRFNPEGQLATVAEPLLEAENNMPSPKLAQSDMILKEPFLILIHEDDCMPESLLLENEMQEPQKPAYAIGATATSFRSPLPVDDKVHNFSKGAILNAVERSSDDGLIIEDDWAQALIKTCQKIGVKNIVTAYMPLGPNADAFAKAKPVLSQAGIKVSQIIRPWDKHVWPYANRGFFKVKKKMTSILDTLEQQGVQGQLL
ncbi:MAG: FAD-binding domain-containing protein [Maricaulaceae bacterium]